MTPLVLVLQQSNGCSRMEEWVKADQEACDRVLTAWDALTQSLEAMGSSEIRTHAPTETMSTTLYSQPAVRDTEHHVCEKAPHSNYSPQSGNSLQCSPGERSLQG